MYFGLNHGSSVKTVRYFCLESEFEKVITDLRNRQILIYFLLTTPADPFLNVILI